MHYIMQKNDRWWQVNIVLFFDKHHDYVRTKSAESKEHQNMISEELLKKYKDYNIFIGKVVSNPKKRRKSTHGNT